MPQFETRIAGQIVSPVGIGAARVFVASGLPLAVTGSNNDIHIDTAGSKSGYRPTVYQKQAGSWVAVA